MSNDNVLDLGKTKSPNEKISFVIPTGKTTWVSDKSTWVSDKTTESCYLCNRAFTVFFRKHHCRICGKIFCENCSDFWVLKIWINRDN